MGPPLNLWLINEMIVNPRVLSLHFAFILLIVQTVFNLSYITAVPAEGETAPIDMTDVNSVCGRRLWKEPTARIVNGKEATFADWPWMISIYKISPTSGNKVYYCGASLLNKDWAITAAHCVYNDSASDIILRFGDHDREHDTESLPSEDRRVKEIVVYPNYDVYNSEVNDLALLKFDSSVGFKQNILPVCLPKGHSNYEEKTVYATGWGATSHINGAKASVTLQQARMVVISNEDCQYLYETAQAPPKITDKHICTVGDRKSDHCHGDSGGPLVIHNDQDDRYDLIGVISFGMECGAGDIPGGSMRVDAYMDWITPIISQ